MPVGRLHSLTVNKISRPKAIRIGMWLTTRAQRVTAGQSRHLRTALPDGPNNHSDASIRRASRLLQPHATGPCGKWVMLGEWSTWSLGSITPEFRKGQ